jgi:hypothetical protein
VKVYDVRRRTPSDGKSSRGLWPGELKRPCLPILGAPEGLAVPALHVTPINGIPILKLYFSYFPLYRYTQIVRDQPFFY